MNFNNTRTSSGATTVPFISVTEALGHGRLVAAALRALGTLQQPTLDAVMNACMTVAPEPALMHTADRAVRAVERLNAFAGANVYTSDVAAVRFMLDQRTAGATFDQIADQLEAQYTH